MSVSNEEIVDFLSDDLGVDTRDVRPDTRLFSSGIIDSFALVSLMTFLEKRCGFRINPIDVNLDNMDSVERIVAFAQRAESG